MAEESFRSGPRKVDGQNRISLPPEVREFLGITEGDYVRYVIEGKQVILKKTRWLGD